LKAGDHILAVDGKPASGIALNDLHRSLRIDPEGAIVTLKDKRG